MSRKNRKSPTLESSPSSIEPLDADELPTISPLPSDTSHVVAVVNEPLPHVQARVPEATIDTRAVFEKDVVVPTVLTEVVDAYRVMETTKCSLGGHLTVIEKGSIVRRSGYGPLFERMLLAGVKLEPIKE